MRRISVVGSSGSGKTTTAARVAGVLGVRHVELDAIYHQPDWVPLDREAFRARVSELIAVDGWVVDGNYSAVRDLVWARADTVVWLDVPRRVAVWQVARRSVGRVVRRTELWNGNRERWRNLFTRDPDESVIRHTWQNHRRNHERYDAARREPRYGHLRFVQLRSRREVDAFVGGLSARSSSAR